MLCIPVTLLSVCGLPPSHGLLFSNDVKKPPFITQRFPAEGTLPSRTDTGLDIWGDRVPSLLRAGGRYGCFSFLLAIPFLCRYYTRFTYRIGFFLLNPLGCLAQFLCWEKRESSLCADFENFFACLPVFSIEEGWICCLTLCLHPV